MRPGRRSWPARLRERTPGVFVMPGSRRAGPGPALFGKDESRKRKKGAAAPFSGFHPPRKRHVTQFGAGNETRTRDLNLGKVALYQLSYSRLGAAHSTRLPGGALALRCKKMSAAGRHGARSRFGPSGSRFCGRVGSAAALCAPGRAAAGRCHTQPRPSKPERTERWPWRHSAGHCHLAESEPHCRKLERRLSDANNKTLPAALEPAVSLHRETPSLRQCVPDGIAPATRHHGTTQPARYFSGFSGSLPRSALSCRQVFKGWAVADSIAVTSRVSSRACTFRQAQP